MIPTDGEELIQEAVAAFDVGDLERAEHLLKKVDSSFPNQPAVLHLRGLVALRAKKPDFAIGFLKQAVAIGQTVDLLNALGSAYGQTGALQDAVEILNRAVNMAPNDTVTAFNLGNALRADDRPSEALRHYQSAVRIDPGFTDAYYNMGLSLMALGRLEDAVGAFDQCLEINPDDIEATKNRGNALFRMGKKEEAVSQMEKVLALNPEDADGYFNLANVLHSQRKYDRALELFEKALDLKPGKESYIVNYAMVLKDLGETDSAIEHLKSVRKEGKLSSIGHSNLIFCMCNAPDYGPEEILKEAKHWNKMQALPLGAEAVSHANDPNLEHHPI